MAFFGRTSCDLQVPYKIDPNPWKQHQNWLAVERWATYFARNCMSSGGSCLTATSTTQVFDPTSAGGNGARTSPWQPYAAMNLVTLRARCAYEPSGGDIEVLLWDEVSATQLGSTVTLVDATDTEASWTGTVAVDTSMRIYFEVNGSVAIELFEIEAWFDGAGGGGLILYPEGGV